MGDPPWSAALEVPAALLPVLEGLQEGCCVHCGALALYDVAYRGVRRCSLCWAALTGQRIVPWPRPNYAGGLRPGPATTSTIPAASGDVPGASDRPGPVAKGTAVATIYPPVELAPDDARVPANLRRAVAGAVLTPWRLVLAQCLREDGQRVDSVSWRVRRLGYAVYVDGSAKSAVVAAPHLRTCTVTEFAALAAGQTYAPPPRKEPAHGHCFHCNREVRLKVDGTPYAHKNPLSGERCSAG